MIKFLLTLFIIMSSAMADIRPKTGIVTGKVLLFNSKKVYLSVSKTHYIKLKRKAISNKYLKAGQVISLKYPISYISNMHLYKKKESK